MNSSFSAKGRTGMLHMMAQAPQDVLVIGGGITGAGIALDAAARGMRVALLEMQDFAAGTSSRSTKLVHGGLRYLKQLEVGIVAEVGRERAIVYENGPHVTTPEPMLLPIYKGGTFGRTSTSLGLKVYDWLAGVKGSERRCMLSPAQTLEREPLLRQEGLQGGGLYVEYRTDDARLTLEVLKEAVAQGALAVNYAKVTGFLYDSEGKACGVQVMDRVSGTALELRARQIVNAAGPWVDALRDMDGSRQGKVLQLTKGVHLVFDQVRFPLRQAVYFDTPDGRMVFAIPREGKTYVGTTDTVYGAERDIARPPVEQADVRYLLHAISGMFPSLGLAERDVESSWAGVRPLIYEEGKAPSEISRRDEIWTSPSGVLTIAGGKLPISGGQVGGGGGFAAFVRGKRDEGAALGLSPELAEHWARRYGANVDRLFVLAKEAMKQRAAAAASMASAAGGDLVAAPAEAGASSAAAKPAGADAGLTLPLEAEVPLQYAMAEEMAVTPGDFFIRRTGALLFDIAWVRRYQDPVIRYMAKTCGWPPETEERYRQELERELREAAGNWTGQEG
ncbi:glycerol-3-phosphate dehydrogenase [Paenibacillus antibioticophila]|uniref:Glycerol-3-phosphate dehydrogenase n=1 Tax=Paenibacillus antibioticophila TaxID=1274374 RepID=A0A919XWB9_9BACL|nr:FAD-dependent oxidoreductase [Paenibacillus antibioticophila]GIO39209.1 glycerol-3-phosphate dehydrogenase [Paenibacillus antibioticophila]